MVDEPNPIGQLLPDGTFHRLILQSLPGIAVIVFDKNMRYLAAKGQFLEAAGFPAKQVVGKTFQEVVPLDAQATLLPKYQAALAGQEIEFERHRDSYFYHACIGPVRNDEGEIIAGVIVAQDITEQKQAEQAIIESEARYRLLAENSSDLVIQLNLAHEYIYISPSSERILGYTPEEMLGKTGFDFVHPDDVRFIREVRVVREQHAAESEPVAIRFRHRQGHYIWLERTGRRLYSETTQELIGFVVSCRDVTARHETEKALRESETLLRSVVTTLSEGIVLFGQDGAIQICNAAAERILGLTADQMIGRTAVDPRWHTIHEDGSPFPGETHPSMVTLRTGQRFSGVIMGVHQPNGELRWVSINSLPIMQSHDTIPYAAVVTFTDITTRHQTEEALRESEAQLRLLLQNSLEGILLLDESRKILSANPAACLMCGYSEAELNEHSLDQIIDSSDSRLSKFHQEIRRSGVWRGELTGLRQDGTLFPIDVSVAAFVSSDGSRQTWNIVRDLSEQKRYQAAVIEEEKLRTALEKESELSQLKSHMMVRVAHEFRTPLTVIQSTTETLTHYIDRLTPEQRATKAANIQGKIRRLTDMLDEIDLAIRGSLAPNDLQNIPVNLSLLCRWIAHELEERFGLPGKYVLDIPESLTVVGDPVALKNAVLHVMRNAARFSAPLDAVTVTLAAYDQGIEIYVVDKGLGVLRKEHERLFEPFFRGSNIGEISGLGLGLTIARAAIEAHQGTIQIESVAGQGTTVRIWLPQTPA